MDAVVSTNVVVKTGKGKWLVHGFNGLECDYGVVTKSPVLKIGGHDFTIELNAGGVAPVVAAAAAGGAAIAPFPVVAMEDRQPSLFIRNSNPSLSVKCTYGIFIESPEGTVLAHWERKHVCIMPPHSGYGYNAIGLSRRKIQAACLFDGTLIITVEITIYDAPETLIDNGGSKNLSCGGLHLDMAKLLASGTGDDVKFMVRGSTYSAHRFLLAARSPVFQGMFQHQMHESTSGQVEIHDIERSVFSELLTFLYTGQCNVTSEISNTKPVVEKKEEKEGKEEKREGKEEGRGLEEPEVAEEVMSAEQLAAKLLMAAHKYQVQALMDQCGQMLLRTLGEENALERFALADTCRYLPLKNAALNMITRDSSELEKYKSKSAFGKLSHSQLMTIIDCITPTGRAKRKRSSISAVDAVDDEPESAPSLPLDSSSSAAPKITRLQVKRMRLSELRVELEERGLATDGKRALLQDRLLAVIE